MPPQLFLIIAVSCTLLSKVVLRICKVLPQCKYSPNVRSHSRNRRCKHSQKDILQGHWRSPAGTRVAAGLSATCWCLPGRLRKTGPIRLALAMGLVLRCSAVRTRSAGGQCVGFVHVEVQAEKAAVRQVLQSSQAAHLLPRSAMLVSEPIALFWVQQILLALALSVAVPDHTCSLDRSHPSDCNVALHQDCRQQNESTLMSQTSSCRQEQSQMAKRV